MEAATLDEIESVYGNKNNISFSTLRINQLTLNLLIYLILKKLADEIQFILINIIQDYSKFGMKTATNFELI